MMPNLMLTWTVVVAVVILVPVTVGRFAVSENSDYGLAKLENLLLTDSNQLCHYVTCQEPVSPDACPDGTLYMEGTSQFGCCGACVAFRQSGEQCSGNIDPAYGEGYTRGEQPPITFMASIYNASDNVVNSLWCDYGHKCHSNQCDRDPKRKDCKSMLDHYLFDIQNTSLYKYYRDDYRWKPNCMADGKYEAKQCLGPLDQQRCVCMDPYGNRIFGLAFLDQEELFRTMNCKCSRQVWEKKQAGQTSVTLHCLENGNFESLQCEDGWCYCINSDTAEPYGSRLPETAMHLLPCYNKTTTGEQYLRRCESEYHAHAKLVEAMAESGVKGPQSLTPCDQDGSYQSKQCDQTMCRCYDKYFVEALSFPAGDDCQCARDQKYYQDTNAQIKVGCIPNSGAYEEEQDMGIYKYCVDEDGIRSGPLVMNSPEYTLQCDESQLCQKNGAEGTTHCSKACIGREISDAGVSLECPKEAYANYQSKTLT